MFTPHTYYDSRLVSGFGPFPTEHHYPRTNATDRDATARRLIARGCQHVRFVTDRVTYDGSTQTRTRETVRTITDDAAGRPIDSTGATSAMTTTTRTAPLPRQRRLPAPPGRGRGTNLPRPLPEHRRPAPRGDGGWPHRHAQLSRPHVQD